MLFLVFFPDGSRNIVWKSLNATRKNDGGDEVADWSCVAREGRFKDEDRIRNIFGDWSVLADVAVAVKFPANSRKLG